MVNKNQQEKVNLSINTGINMGIRRIMSPAKGIGVKLVVGTEMNTGVGIKNTVKMINTNI